MPGLGELLHGAHHRRIWRGLWLLAALVTAGLAFAPDPAPPSHALGDKFNHLLAFGTLALLGCFSHAAQPCRLAPLGALLLGYGGLIEAVQSQLPTRNAEWADLAADAAGIVIGWALANALRRAAGRPPTPE